MRNRSMALVVRDSKILMIHTYRFNRYIYELPGGGIEAGESPEAAAIRELREECGLDGVIIKPLNVLHRPNGSVEYVFLVDVSKEQEPIVGMDPEVADGEEQAIKDVCWKSLQDVSFIVDKHVYTRCMQGQWIGGLFQVINLFIYLGPLSSLK